MRTRRAFVAGSLAAAITFPIAEGAELPKGLTLQHGDLIWIRGANDYIPYNSGNDAERWYRQRDDHAVNGGVSVAELKQMSYEEYLEYYLGDRRIGNTDQNFSGGSGGVYVGHVAILSILGGAPYVVEASLRQGVTKTPLAEWAKSLPHDTEFWSGRLLFDVDTIARIVSTAEVQLGKPYDFWNFDLSSAAGFYCSKLIWYAVMKGAGVALDDVPSPKRALWYSPKQMHRSAHLKITSGRRVY
ncbi:MAG: YiiX/YebB-like N1pC/P60 family cysteine hydrolase [Hyphomicrobiaceae bacterium]